LGCDSLVVVAKATVGGEPRYVCAIRLGQS